MRRRRLRDWLSALVVVVLVAAGAYVVFRPGDDGLHLSADFSRTVGLYAGDDVRVLGVKVGTIDSVSPRPKYVHVTMTLDPGVDVPAGAEAAIVAPNLVTSRFVQLTPAYVSGPALADDAEIPASRTAVPIEFDDVKTQLTRLATALGPTLRDSKGALAGVLDTADANLTGSATQLRTMLRSLSLASATLSDNRGNLFGTVRGLQTFITALARSDASVRSFSGQLNSASDLLSDDSSSLGTALSQLDSAVGDVTTFVKNNRSALKNNVSALATLAKNLAAKQYQFADLLHVAPTGLSSFYNLIDDRYQAAVGTLAIGNFDSLAQLVCRQIVETGGFVNTCLSLLNPLLKQIGLSGLPLSVQDAIAKSVQPSSAASTSSSSTSSPSGSSSGSSSGSDPTGLLGLLLPGSGS